MQKMLLNEYVNKTLNKQQIIAFDPRLIDAHLEVPHPIMSIPRNYTLIDALIYVFDNDPNAVAHVLQDYQDGIKYTNDLFSALENGIKSKSICMTCVREGVRNFRISK